jgi:nucleoside-diphosphate-sugar epimerase
VPSARRAGRADVKSTREHILLTGFPGFISKPLLRQLLSSNDVVVTAVVEADRQQAAEAAVAELAVEQRPQVRLVHGDVRHMDLGLSGQELAQLADVSIVLHLAGVQRSDAPAALLRAVNVDGVRHALQLATELPKLQRFVHFSSCFVAGDGHGVVLEETLESSAFRTPYEASKQEGERLARAAMSSLPVTIIRPSIVVGDSTTGEIDRFEGVYAVGILIVTSPVSIPLPLPGPAVAPLHLVPVDYVVRATLHLMRKAEAVGQTCHVVDPNPLSARQVYDLVAARVGKKSPPTMPSSKGVASAIATMAFTRIAKGALKLPLLEKWTKTSPHAVDLFDRFVLYNAYNTHRLLDGSGIQCPRFDAYVDALVSYVTTSLRRQQREKRENQAKRRAPRHALD